MFYLTGDTHGEFRGLCSDIRRLGLTADDCCVILGDAGFNFYGSQTDRAQKKAVDALGVPVLCVHGNHEMRPASTGLYELRDWRGGRVWVEPEFEHLLFAKDGEIYDFDGKSAVVIGGAYSVDVFYRLARNPYNPKWWPDEQPDDATKAFVMSQLERRGWQVDLVLTHTCPARFIPTEMFLPGLDQTSVDRSTEEWLGAVEAKLRYEAWYCGHWHTDKTVEKMHFLFHDMIPLGG